jgi:AcrR family transcriptional regulator
MPLLSATTARGYDRAMSRPPRARESVLDAFERLLIENGERSATMDATARAAGVSKGGLLYHFASKEALEAGLVDRLSGLVDADIVQMSAAGEGPVAYFLRTSVMDDDPLDRAIIAVSRIAQGGSATAGTALREMRVRWQEALRPYTKDAAALDLVMLVSDGLYFNNALEGGVVSGAVPHGEDLDRLIALVGDAARP